jgi:hypothetical protein
MCLIVVPQVIGLKAVCICALLFAADGILLLAFSSWKLLFSWGAILAACQAIRPLRTSYVLMATPRGCPSPLTHSLSLFCFLSYPLPVVDRANASSTGVKNR